jgi:uncharacterized protein YigA (DUF484 family)
LYFEDEAADYRIEKIDLSPALTKENAKKLSLSEKDLDRLIGRIIKEFSAGKSIEQIAKKNREALENNKKLQEALSKRPLPMTCPDQLKEVREIGVELSKGWNK